MISKSHFTLHAAFVFLVSISGKKLEQGTLKIYQYKKITLLLISIKYN
jgi:hypothetical protein